MTRESPDPRSWTLYPAGAESQTSARPPRAPPPAAPPRSAPPGCPRSASGFRSTRASRGHGRSRPPTARAARGRPPSHLSRRAPCAAQPGPRPLRTGRSRLRSRPRACPSAACRRAGGTPSPSRSSGRPGPSGCTRALRTARRPLPRCAPSAPPLPPAERAKPCPCPRRTAGCRAARRRARTRPRTAAGWLPPGGARCCVSPGGGCRICRALASSDLRLRQLELDDEGHVVRQREAALGERGVPLEDELRAVDDRLEVDADLGVARDVLVRAHERAAAGDGVGVALDGELAVYDQLVALDVQVARLVAELGVVLGVEEVRRLEVCRQVLVLHDDRVGVDRPDQLRLPVLADLERGVEVLEAAAECRDDHVLHGEARARMDLVELPGAGRNLLLSCYSHFLASVERFVTRAPFGPSGGCTCNCIT